jgi:D-arginine dehydrogenase
LERFDVVIIGGGMAGASLACFLGSDDRVLLLEQETHPGYPATGRSAALYTQVYGNAVVRALTVASKAFWEQPPKRFSDVSLLAPRGALFIARAEQLEKLKAETIKAQRLAPNVRMVDVADALTLSPALRLEYLAAGSYEPDAMDIDVDSILQGFLKGARHSGRLLGWMRPSLIWRSRTTVGAWKQLKGPLPLQLSTTPLAHGRGGLPEWWPLSPSRSRPSDERHSCFNHWTSLPSWMRQ